MDKYGLRNKLTELVALKFDTNDQRNEGIWPPHTDLERWKKRYQGITDLPPHMVELNMFKNDVDGFVSMLLMVIDDYINTTSEERENGNG